MNKSIKIDFISTIISSDLSGASMKNKRIAEKVKKKIDKDQIDLNKSNDKIINDLIIMLGYAQILD